MALKGGIWGILTARHAASRWGLRARDAARTYPATPRVRTARSPRAQLNAFLNRAETGSSTPQSAELGRHIPHHADWAWRPALWSTGQSVAHTASLRPPMSLGDEITVFHDSDLAEIALRQRENIREIDLPPYGLEFEVLGFDGEYLSVVIDLPAEALKDLSRSHILNVTLALVVEKPVETFVRLNVCHGPNTEKLTREIDPDRKAEGAVAEFDLAYTKLNEKRIERAWIDIIFAAPRMNRIALRDVTLARVRRLEL